jgi:FAD:protein FMN transferase
MYFNLIYSSFLNYLSFTIICLSFISCESENKNILKRTQFIMGTLVEITVEEFDKDLAQKAINKSFNEMSRLEKIMSSYLPDSELSKFNSLAGEEVKVSVSPDLLKVIKRGVYWGKLSNGAIDISIGPAIKLWEFNSERPIVPDKKNLVGAAKFINYKDIIIEANSISLKKKGMSLNLGAIGKGFAVDQAIRELKKIGIKSGLINAGGDLRAFGLITGRRPWHIGIQHPRKPEQIIISLDIKDTGVATTGDYQRYFIKNKARYHHILNPKNGWPSNKTISATVVADTVMDADALSTALFILGTKKGIDFINSLDGVEGMIVSDRGYASYSSGFHNISGFSLQGLKNNFITK